MNILFLSRDYPPSLIGGVGIYVYEISHLLAKMGHQVYVLSQADEFACEYEDKGVHVFRVKPAKFNFLNPIRKEIKGFLERLEYSYSISKKIKEINKRYKIDIIESCEARAEGFWFYIFRNRPFLVIKLHTPESIVFKLDLVPKSLDYSLIKLLEECWIRRAKQIIGLSKSVVDLTLDYFKIHSNNFPIVPNPIDIEMFKPDENNKIFKEPIILYVGRLEFRKGVHVLIRSIPLVLEQFPEAKFLFIGDDCGMKPYLLSKVNELKLNNNVFFINQIPRNRLVKYYQQSTICVIPSLWENHPYVILEAMACGKPVVATKVGGIPEIIQDKIDGILVPAGSPVALSEGIINLLKNKNLRETLGKNARRKMEDIYSPYEVARKTSTIYKTLMKTS